MIQNYCNGFPVLFYNQILAYPNHSKISAHISCQNLFNIIVSILNWTNIFKNNFSIKWLLVHSLIMKVYLGLLMK